MMSKVTTSFSLILSPGLLVSFLQRSPFGVRANSSCACALTLIVIAASNTINHAIFFIFLNKKAPGTSRGAIRSLFIWLLLFAVIAARSLEPEQQVLAR